MIKFNLKVVGIEKPDEMNFILGQTHFIKSLEDLYEAIINSVPNAKFGIAFCEASGACKIRYLGNDKVLEKLAVKNASKIGAGHSFIIFMKNCFPINILNKIKNVYEVCSIFCATANPTKVIIAESTYEKEIGRGILGVIDGFIPKGVENKEDIKWRKDFLRDIGYKL
ncbi:MAG: adenosine-specific kinase [Candidatus Thermoplasmatota archaeon]|nr:adenosine-specific kinase [Candidatus Thermoplasmatota archaeon]